MKFIPILYKNYIHRTPIFCLREVTCLLPENVTLQENAKMTKNRKKQSKVVSWENMCRSWRQNYTSYNCTVVVLGRRAFFKNLRQSHYVAQASLKLDSSLPSAWTMGVYHHAASLFCNFLSFYPCG